MFFLIALIAAALAWFVGRRLFSRTGLPTREILYADVGSTFPQPPPLISKRYRLSGKPDYFVRVKDGIAPVENIFRRLRENRGSPTPRPFHRVVLDGLPGSRLFEVVAQNPKIDSGIVELLGDTFERVHGNRLPPLCQFLPRSLLSSLLLGRRWTASPAIRLQRPASRRIEKRKAENSS